MKPVLNNQLNFSPGDVVAVGDVHGRIDLVWELVNKLRDTGANLLFLGDLIDRARKKGDDVAVLNVVKSLMDRPEAYGLASVEALRGNHEQMFLDAVAAGPFDWGGDVSLWIQNGGDISSFEEMKPHASWIRDLPLFKQVGSTVFVHAGLRPRIPLHEQATNDLIWIRNPFLRAGAVGVEGVDLVVHGHTPDFEEPGKIEVTDNRINLDSGAFFSGKLTGYNLNTNELFSVTNPTQNLG